MLGNDYPDQVCSIARSLEVVGERWTLLVLRDCFIGITKFDGFIDSLGITRTVLIRRLNQLIADGVLIRVLYQKRPDRYEYLLTPKGKDLFGVVALLLQWGDRYYPHPAGPPRALVHRNCGGTLDEHLSCGSCTMQLTWEDIRTVPNPLIPAA
jgi:DNA-binding HxlR family transcriptional regulator